MRVSKENMALAEKLRDIADQIERTEDHGDFAFAGVLNSSSDVYEVVSSHQGPLKLLLVSGLLKIGCEMALQGKVSVKTGG